MPRPTSPSQLPVRSGERAIGIVEIVIAAVIVMVCVAAAAGAMISTESASVKMKASTDAHAVAEKAVERLRNDAARLAGCERPASDPSAGWVESAAKIKSGDATAFAPCEVEYRDITDPKGRQYEVDLVVTPEDLPGDGLGPDDADGDVRDRYATTTVVQLAAGSRAGLESVEPIEVHSTVQIDGAGKTDDATVMFYACGHEFVDHSTDAGNCMNAVSTPSAGIQSLAPAMDAVRIDPDGTTTVAGSITAGTGTLHVGPGSYRFQAPESVTHSGVAYTLVRITPQRTDLEPSAHQAVYAVYEKSPQQVRVCTQISNWTGPNDDGYEVLETNLHVHRKGNPLSRSSRIYLNEDRSWNCSASWAPINTPRSYIRYNNARPATLSTGVLSHRLYDPGKRSPLTDLAPGTYDLEVEQVQPENSLLLTAARLDCTLPAYDAPLGGASGAITSRTRDELDGQRVPVPPLSRPAWYGRLDLGAGTGTRTICLRFTSRQFQRVACTPITGQTVNFFTADTNGCFLSRFECKLPAGVVDNDDDCWNGADVCSTCADGGSGSTGTLVAGSSTNIVAGGISGGPNVPTVGCTTSLTGYNLPPVAGGTGSVYYGEFNSGNNHDPAVWRPRTWVGGNSHHYYPTFKGLHAATRAHTNANVVAADAGDVPDHPIYRCDEISFSVTTDLLGPGSDQYRYFDCLDVQAPNGRRIRGRVLDVSGGTDRIYTTIGGALALAPAANLFHTFWNPYGHVPGTFQHATNGGIGWPNYTVTRVVGATTCGEPMVHVDPEIIIEHHRVHDRPEIFAVPPPSAPTPTSDTAGI